MCVREMEGECVYGGRVQSGEMSEYVLTLLCSYVVLMCLILSLASAALHVCSSKQAPSYRHTLVGNWEKLILL